MSIGALIEEEESLETRLCNNVIVHTLCHNALFIVFEER